MSNLVALGLAAAVILPALVGCYLWACWITRDWP